MIFATALTKTLVEFIVKARAAPTTERTFKEAIGGGIGVEYLADVIRHGLLVSQSHRDDVTLRLVLEKSDRFSRVVSLIGAQLGSFDDDTEAGLLSVISDALKAGEHLNKEESVSDQRGCEIEAVSFERLIKPRLMSGPVFLLDKKGQDIREMDLPAAGVFVLTDHTPLPKNTAKSMLRQGAVQVSLGPKMLHAAQCLTLILNEYDRRQ